jgi:hypothetical protein
VLSEIQRTGVVTLRGEHVCRKEKEGRIVCKEGEVERPSGEMLRRERERERESVCVCVCERGEETGDVQMSKEGVGSRE